MTTALQAALLGIVQGLTEFLPISSTAHLLIGERLLGFDDPGSVFTEMIQLGSILAIVWLYRQKIVDVVAGLPAPGAARRFAVNVVIGVLPLLVVGALASDFIESVLHRSMTTIGVAFILGGIVMLMVDRMAAADGDARGAVSAGAMQGAVPGGAARAAVLDDADARLSAAPAHREPPRTHSMDAISNRQAAGIGLGHVVALIPGVSRSGATIVSGLLAGLDRPTAAEFSFFLAMPALAAAFVHSLLQVRDQITSDRIVELAIGFVMAFLASLVVVKPFLAIIRRRGFAPFAWYRILAGAMVLAAVAAGWLA